MLLNQETGCLYLCFKYQPCNLKQFSSQLKPANKNSCCQTLILVHSFFNWLLFKSFHTDFDTKSLHSSTAFMNLSLTSLEPMTDSCTDNKIPLLPLCKLVTLRATTFPHSSLLSTPLHLHCICN